MTVIEFAENSNNCTAIREFDVNEKLVKDWRKNKSKLVDAPKSEKRRVIRISPFDNIEKELVKWIHAHRQTGIVVTSQTRNIFKKDNRLYR